MVLRDILQMIQRFPWMLLKPIQVASGPLITSTIYTFKTDEIIGLSADPVWNGEYKKIFTANLVLSNLDKVTG